MFSGISLKQLIAELYRAIADIAAKLYVNTNSRTLPQKAIAGYSGSYSERFKTMTESVSTIFYEKYCAIFSMKIYCEIW